MRQMSPDLADALAKPGDLHWLSGTDMWPINEDRLKSNVSQILSWRRFPDDFEAHFTMFDALTLIQALNLSSELMSWIDGQLEDYILTCRKDTEALENFMLCDLILDHYPLDHALKLSRQLLTSCRYGPRVDQFLSWVRSHRKGISRELEMGLRGIGLDLCNAGDKVQQRVGKELLRSLEPVNN